MRYLEIKKMNLTKRLKTKKIKLNNYVKKIKKHIEENNNKILAIENKLAHTENERDNLLLNSNQLYSTLKGTKNEL